MAVIQQMLLSAGGYTPPAVTYATWDPSRKGAGITLSNGNLTAEVSGATSVACTVSKSSGTWYWEITVDSVNEAYSPGVGVCTTLHSQLEYPGGPGGRSAAYFSGGGVYGTGALIGTLAPYAAGDTISFTLIAGTSIAIRKNDSLQATFPNDASSWGAVAGTAGGGATSQVTANFGATPFKYTPPAGANAGLYI